MTFIEAWEAIQSDGEPEVEEETGVEKPSPFVFSSSISYTKEHLVERGKNTYKEYIPFMVNRSLSYYQDTILAVEEVNMRPAMPKRMQYEYLLETVRKKARKADKWPKPVSTAIMNAVMKYYDYNRARALEAIKVLDPEQVKAIYEKMRTVEGD